MSRYSSRDDSPPRRAPAREEAGRLFVGSLGARAEKEDVERAFSRYGPLTSVWMARNPPGFAFVEFEDPRDAEDALRGLDGAELRGSRVRVERSAGRSRGSARGRASGRGGFNPSDRCYECGERGHYAYDCEQRRGPPARSGAPSRRRSRSSSGGRTRSPGPRGYGSSYRRSRSGSPSRARSASPAKRRSGSRAHVPGRRDWA